MGMKNAKIRPSGKGARQAGMLQAQTAFIHEAQSSSLQSWIGKNVGESLARERNNIKQGSFQYNKRRLRMFYKLLKAGMILPEDVPNKFRGLLIRYYGLPEGFWNGVKKSGDDI
jgi:hypothetical protein